MKRLVVMSVIVVGVAALAGCNTVGRQPQLKDATISPLGLQPGTAAREDMEPGTKVPSALKPGDSGVITAKVVDKHGIIAQVRGVVDEDPRMKFQLMDNGVAPDAAASDGIWSLQVDVPFMAPPGDFTLRLAAYKSNGEAIRVKPKGGEIQPLEILCPFTIQYPEEKPAPAEEKAEEKKE